MSSGKLHKKSEAQAHSGEFKVIITNFPNQGGAFLSQHVDTRRAQIWTACMYHSQKQHYYRVCSSSDSIHQHELQRWSLVKHSIRRKQMQNRGKPKTEKKTTVLADSRLLEYNSQLDYSAVARTSITHKHSPNQFRRWKPTEGNLGTNFLLRYVPTSHGLDLYDTVRSRRRNSSYIPFQSTWSGIWNHESRFRNHLNATLPPREPLMEALDFRCMYIQSRRKFNVCFCSARPLQEADEIPYSRSQIADPSFRKATYCEQSSTTLDRCRI